jgi:hypothetical protein
VVASETAAVPLGRIFMRVFTRRTLIGSAAGAGASAFLAPMVAFGQGSTASDEVHVRDFGAVGDGRTNDTDAIRAAARALEARGGGTLVFEKKTYLIGKQARGVQPGKWAFAPSPVVEILRCPRKVTIAGNGAILRCAPGLRYGTFHPRTGAATRNAMPFTNPAELATPYKAAIWLQENRGGVEIRDFELDGRIQDAVIGGPWGDTGWQINHCGIWLYNNRGSHLVRNVHTHHHGQDGLLLFAEIKSEASPAVPMRVENVRSEYNGRQGISITGGKGIVLADCKLNHTGRNGRITSNPGAGLDIEAEMSLIRDVTVLRCEFKNNYGPGMVADTGDSKLVRFEDCSFAGSTNYAAWPNKPAMSFHRCEFAGAITRCYESPKGGPLATQFYDCTFHDTATASAGGKVYGTRIDLGGSGGGTLFRKCTFRYTGPMQLPYTPHNVRYVDCTMSQRHPAIGYPTGIYTGRNVIRGNVDLGAYSESRGAVILNGRTLPRTI